MAHRRKKKRASAKKRRKGGKRKHKLSKKTRMARMRAGLRKYWKDVKAGRRRGPKRRKHKR